MKSAITRTGLAIALAVGLRGPCVGAEEAATKALPTLLIKGEVVSLDAADPAANLLKVKDRYGFETPIYLTPETKVMQGDQTMAASTLAVGTAVEVEYNFDVNTAKRHAVSVKLSAPASSQAAAAPAAPEAPAPMAPAEPQMDTQPAAPEAAPAAPAEPVQPAEEPAAAPTTPQ